MIVAGINVQGRDDNLLIETNWIRCLILLCASMTCYFVISSKE